MVSPFQAQQFSDPRIAVLQNAYNAQNKRDLQGMENRNRTLNSALAVGGSLLKDYATRADDRRQANSLLESVGAPEDFGGGKVGLKGILDYMTAQTNSQNAGSNIQGVLAKTLPYLPDDEAPAAAKAILDGLSSQGGFNWGPRQPGQATVFGNTLNGQPAPQTVDPNLVSSTSGTIPAPNGATPGQATVTPGPLTTDDLVEETLNNITSGSANSPAGRDKQLDKAQLADAEAKAVSNRVKARQAVRFDSDLERYTQSPLDRVIDKDTGEDLIIDGKPISPDASTRSSKSYLQTMAKTGDEAGLRALTSGLNDTVSSTHQYLKLVNKTLEDMDFDPEQAKRNSNNFVSNTASTIQNFTRDLTKSNTFSKDLVSTEVMADLDALKGLVAKGKAKALEGGRLSDMDFKSMVETLGASPGSDPKQLRANALTVSMLEVNKVLETIYALGDRRLADGIISEYKKLGGDRVTVDDNGKLNLTPIREYMSGSSTRPTQTRQAAPVSTPAPVQRAAPSSGASSVTRDRIRAVLQQQAGQ